MVQEPQCSHFILSAGQKVSYLRRHERLAADSLSPSLAVEEGVPPRLRHTFVLLGVGTKAGSHAQVCTFTHPFDE